MKITKIEDIKSELFKEEAAASAVTDYIVDEMKKASEGFSAEKTKLEDALKEEQSKLEEFGKKNEELAASQEEINKTLENAQKKIEELEAAAAERENQDRFNSRMASLDDRFKLSDEEREVIASEIAELDDESFAKYEKKLSVFLKREAKASEKEEKKEDKTEEATASAEEVIEEATKDGKKEEDSVANTSTPKKEGLYAKYKEDFGPSGWETDINID